MSAVAPGPAVGAIPHAALGASALFRSYLAGEEAALRFYRWSPHSAQDRAEAARVAAEAATQRGHRDAVAHVLAEQNRGWGSSEAVLDHVEALREPDSVAIVTGQQLGLFAGPLYTVYKARTAVRLAARLAEETGRPVVPVFWLADEDHDFEEIHRAVFVDGEDVRYCNYDDGNPPQADRGAVGRIVLEKGATEQALASLADALPDGPGRAAALELARGAYVPGRTMRDAFALLLRALVPDIVLMSADDARLKRLATSLFAQEVRDWQDTERVLSDRSGALVEAGFHAQVSPSPVNLFVMGEGSRMQIDPAGGDFVLRGTADVLTPDALLARLDGDPASISPNVVLRPLLQDTLVPTAAYVAGPGEAAYFAQLGPVYEAFGVPMPVIEPRLSLTVVEAGVAKVLDRYGLSLPDLAGRPGGGPQETLHALWRRFALDASDLDLDAAFDRARKAALAALDELQPVAREVDAALASTVGAARRKVEKALEVLETKTVRLEKRNHEVVRARLARAQAALWPEGHLQERWLGPLGVVARHGPGALADLVHAVPLDATAHHLVRP
ncbi:bacillithiol biosynthesis cysteine-adding enzyme BshC [Rubrivirga marina]|uniref:Putative cysteine ligase BshC n=1 Tax=Rubrivirga marina TaxID=1196024 RepID=A0A271J1X1_9BACT|nr:bacillithiol biosynthesis cysteine-adding enzyme BshC [Rubrivirga marina]PAP77521.1 bacillithiol biosynthesis cysteine-adding enzyme BshC [Rubrivirga marina]